MKKRHAYCLLSLILAAAGLAGVLNIRLLDLRRSKQLTQADPVENAPPLVAFTTVALGGFRGIAADWLWIRASELQKQGRYFELVQLADWITKLEPRFADVWIFHAWNLSYNISILFDSPEDRWRWVLSGIELIRDEGLKYNPAEPKLFRELGWLFQHKIGGNLDSAHRYYKTAWAETMVSLWGDRPAPPYELYHQLPASRAALLEQPTMQPLLEKAKKDGVSLLNGTDSALNAFLMQSAQQTAADRLRLYLGMEKLIHSFRLNPDHMQQIEKLAGAVDWRLPFTHALYWAHQGHQHTRPTTFEELAAERMMIQCLIQTLLQGRIAGYREDGSLILCPAYSQASALCSGGRHILENKPADYPLHGSLIRLLEEAALVAYLSGNETFTFTCYQEIQTSLSSNHSFSDFLHALAKEQLRQLSAEHRMLLTQGMLFQHFYWKETGQTTRADAFMQLSQWVYSAYQRLAAQTEADRRWGLPPYSELLEMTQNEYEQSRDNFFTGKNEKIKTALKPAVLIQFITALVEGAQTEVDQL